MVQRYVFAMDASDVSKAAQGWAESHAAHTRAPLVRVQVATHTVSAQFSSLAGDVVLLPPGPIPQELARFVSSEDILVIGTGKTGFIHSRVYGARVLQIVSAVPCHVAVVPHVDLRFRSGVVAGIAHDDALVEIIDAAGEEAAARTEPLLLLHSTGTDSTPGAERNGSIVERAKLIATSRWPDLTVRTRCSPRPAAEALLDASRNAALLVIAIGARGALGTVAHDVLVNIDAPVLILRPSFADRDRSV
ncbi:hypothetical protein LZG07_07795 [Microbacterium profundi]|uniref:hypothetical protein n=1 Tax=Microbacterium profundi TaxID=450380 RepID=UPI0019D0AEBA|nr:hypothetical protein [Microbacterium profundi]MCE7481823.1 hypothetical protein [Microbacterium profundi]